MSPFGKSTNEAAPTAVSAADIWAETLSSKNKDTISGGIWPAGPYHFKFTSLDDTKTYEPKKGKYEGQEVPMVKLGFECMNVDPNATYLDKDKVKVLPEEVADKYVGKEFFEFIFLGQDNAIAQMNTILEGILGEEEFAKHATLEETITAAQGKEFIASITHDEYEGRVNARIDLFADWKQL